MQTQGPDHFTSAYGYYRGDDGYLYPIVLNEAEGTPQFPIVVSGVDDGQHFVSGVPFEPPQVQLMAQRVDDTGSAHHWDPAPPPLHHRQDVNAYSQLVPDNQYSDTGDPGGSSETRAAVFPDNQRLNSLPDSCNGLSVRISATTPQVAPRSESYTSPTSPTTQSTSNVDNSGVEQSDENEHDPLEDEIPLIKLGFGAWKCGICGKQLRRKHRAVVHFLNKHGDMRLSCQGRCGVADCNKTFASQDGLDVHLNPVVVVCTACGKSLLKKNILRHRNRHCHPQASSGG